MKKTLFALLSVLCLSSALSAEVVTKHYDAVAKNTYSQNDVKAFVYEWFSGFDHQRGDEYFTKHLDPLHVQMEFPDFPIHSVADFKRWYKGVKDSIRYNIHHLSELKVSGDEKNGYDVSLHVNWVADTYDKKHYDANIAQKWRVIVDRNRNFIITNHKAWMLK